jgi:hypothetical protein
MALQATARQHQCKTARFSEWRWKVLRIATHAQRSLNSCEKKKTDDAGNQTVKCTEKEILLRSFLGTVAHYNLFSICCMTVWTF